MTKYEYQDLIRVSEAVMLLAKKDLLDLSQEPWAGIMKQLSKAVEDNHTII